MDVDFEHQVDGRVLLYTGILMSFSWHFVRRLLQTFLLFLMGCLSAIHQSRVSVFILPHLVSISLSLLLEFNYWMYICEDDMWTGEGHFNNALKDCDPVQWDFDDVGAITLSILMVILLCIFLLFSLKPFFSSFTSASAVSASVAALSESFSVDNQFCHCSDHIHLEYSISLD